LGIDGGAFFCENGTGSSAPPDAGWISLGFKPDSSGHPANLGFLISSHQYYASAHGMFPFYVSYNPSGDGVIFGLDSGNDFTADHTVTSSVNMTKGSWNHLIISWDTRTGAGGTGGFRVWVNGTKTTGGTTRSAAFSAGPSGTYFTFGAAKAGYSTGSGINRVKGQFCELIYGTINDNSKLISDAEATQLYTLFTGGV